MNGAVNGVIPMLYDAIDEHLVSYGARRANTRRLQELIALTHREAGPIVRARLDRGAPLEGLGWSLTWQRRGGAWVLVHALDAEGLSVAEILRATDPHAGKRGRALTAIDATHCLVGPAELIAGDTIKLSALDLERRQFAHDHVALVRADGSLGAPSPAIPGRWAGGAS